MAINPRETTNPVAWRAGLAEDFYRHIAEQEQRHYLTIDELAIVLQTTRQRVYNAVKKHQLPYKMVGRNLVLLRSTVAPYIQTREKATA